MHVFNDYSALVIHYHLNLTLILLFDAINLKNNNVIIAYLNVMVSWIY
jgi:hypothetical protein